MEQGEFDQHALPEHHVLLHILIVPPLPLHLLLVIIILLLLLALLLLLLLFQEFWKSSIPSLLSCRDM